MVVETVKEQLSVNKLIAVKKEIVLIEGDVIVPDSKPDILNTISTSGCVCVSRKEILEDKIRIDGNINTYIMYLADDSNDKVRGINTNLEYLESINIPNIQEGMNSIIETRIKNIEGKVINGRKIGIKAALEVNVRIYSNEEMEIVNDIPNAEGIQLLREDVNVNALVGMGDTKIYAKDTITIDSVDNLAEILKSNVCICDKDIKISYNKILTKAEAEVKIMYLTEDNRINCIAARIPIVGFVDIQNVTEDNICDVSYEIRNLTIKPNPVEEHSIYVEMEVVVNVIVYEEKQMNLIQDIYSTNENLEFNKKKITTITNKQSKREMKQIREKIEVEGLRENKELIDVDINPVVERINNTNHKMTYECSLELTMVLSNQELQVETKTAKIPFEYIIENITDGENINSNMEIEIANQDFIIQDGGMLSSNIDVLMNHNSHKNANLNIMNEIQTNGERELDDYSMVMYIIKRGDTLWNIAKEFGSTVQDIVMANEIEYENKIMPGDKLFIPRYVKTVISNQKEAMIEHV